MRSSSRARGGSDAPGETRRFTHGSIDDDDEHMDGMDDDPSRELEDEDDDDESDDREAFKREQDLQYSMTAIRQKPLSIRASPAVNREETLERWDPDADNASVSGSSNDGGFQMNRRRRLSGRAGRDPAFLPARDETSGGKSSPRSRGLLRPVFGKEELDEVIALAIPALGSLLADPLMSLVDTAVVGRYSSTSLAALGPSTAVFQIVFQVRSS